MIELSDDKDENIQIIGKSQRYNSWYHIEQGIEDLVRIARDYPIKNKDELDKIDNAIKALTDLRASGDKLD